MNCAACWASSPRPRRRPLLFHCVAGKDRTGLIAALLLALADVEPAGDRRTTTR